MKIAQIAPLMESIPPRLYGGSERVVSYLTEELVAQGHDVTLFASGQSITSAKLVPCCAQPLRLNPAVRDIIPYYMLMLDKVRSMASEFDILHFHIDQFQFPDLQRDGAADGDDPARPPGPAGSASPLSRLPGHAAGVDLELAAVADPRRQLRGHHLSRPAPRPDADAEPAGRLSRLPRPHLARRSASTGRSQIARAADLPLKIAAKVDRVDEAYFRAEIEPLLPSPASSTSARSTIAARRSSWVRRARCCFPIDWPEPFGLAMIEAMACGTPVLAFRNGAVPEVIDEGVTGYVVDSLDEAIQALGGVLALDRAGVRRRYEERFTVARMARDYVEVYQRLADMPATSEREDPAHALAATSNGARAHQR